jgi:hypothetical protein
MHTGSKSLTLLANWLAAVDSLPLECDGVSRIVSVLLARDNVAHDVCIGSLEVQGVGRIPLHHWIELPDGVLVDFRAQMWLGSDPAVPHGAFQLDGRRRYVAFQHAGARYDANHSPAAFHILAGFPLDAYPRLPR